MTAAPPLGRGLGVGIFTAWYFCATSRVCLWVSVNPDQSRVRTGPFFPQVPSLVRPRDRWLELRRFADPAVASDEAINEIAAWVQDKEPSVACLVGD